MKNFNIKKIESEYREIIFKCTLKNKSLLSLNPNLSINLIKISNVTYRTQISISVNDREVYGDLHGEEPPLTIHFNNNTIFNKEPLTFILIEPIVFKPGFFVTIKLRIPEYDELHMMRNNFEKFSKLVGIDIQ